MKLNRLILAIVAACFVIVCASVIYIALPVDEVYSASQADSIVEKPAWKVGDWWVIEESQQLIQQAVDNPSWAGPFVWKMEVIGKDNVDGEEYFVVKSVCEEQQASDLVYYRTKDLSLMKLESNHSGQKYTLSGEDLEPTLSMYVTPSFPVKMKEISASAVSLDMPVSKDNRSLDIAKIAPNGKLYINNKERKGSYNGYEIWSPNAPWKLYCDNVIIKDRLIASSWQA